MEQPSTSREPSDPVEQITERLIAWSSGDLRAQEDVIRAVYHELRRMAANYLRAENTGHTLQPTALVHEAYLRLIDQKQVSWQNRAHFFGVAAQMMRRILVDHARSRHRDKRGGGAKKMSLDEALGVSAFPGGNLVSLDEALENLTSFDPRKARVIELRFFGGLSVEETAEVLEVSPQTVIRDWKLAKAWLYQELKSRDQA